MQLGLKKGTVKLAAYPDDKKFLLKVKRIG